MCFRFAALAVLAAAPTASAQDMPLRVEAIQLLERANQASMISGTPNLRSDVSFQAYSLDGNRGEGAIHRIMTKDGQWIESIFGPVHAIALFTRTQVIETQYVPPPPELNEAVNLVPVKLVRFDDSDVIQSIAQDNLIGRPAKCIRFETVTGKNTEQNEICVDIEHGTLLRLRLGNSVIENSDYSQIAGTWFPHQIRHSIDGRMRMELQQNISLIDGPVDLMALAPPSPTILRRCSNFRRAIGLSIPQPPNAGPGPWYDVRIHAVIYQDGRVHEPTVLPQGNSQLEAEAIRLVSTWQYDPATCDGKPTTEVTTLTVHFPPR